MTGQSPYRYLLVEKGEGVATVTINRPDVLNALNILTLEELHAALKNLEADEEVRVIIITGSGDRAFVAGADVAEMKDMSPAQARQFSRRGQEVMFALQNIPKPVIAAVNGFALGGGCELAMACDIRIASEQAKFGQPEVGLGIVPGFGGTQRLPGLVGLGMAKMLIYSGKLIDAATAEKIGLVEMVVPHHQLRDRARELALLICEKPASTLALAKAAINHMPDPDLRAGNAYEAEVFAECFATPEQKEGMSAFLEKRKPLFQRAGGAKTLCHS